MLYLKEIYMKPNVLFIICDDLNDSLEGWGGHPQAKTPHISRLMERGVSFKNAHCNSPLCGPSRASIFSGLYPHTSGNLAFGHWKENSVLKNTVMMQEHFRKNGYQVYGTGKLHHNGQEDHSVYHEYKYDADFGPWPDMGNLAGSIMAVPHPNLSELFDSDNNIRIAWEQTFGPMSNVPKWGSDNPSNAKDGWYLNGKPFRYIDDNDRDLLPDERSTQWAIDKLMKMKEEPFFMGVGFNRPHTPLYVPDEYYDRFPLEDIVIPENFLENCEDIPEIAQSVYVYGRQRFSLVKNAGDEMWRRWIQAYLACVSFVDDQVGKLLDALDASGHAENTLIVFTSDNGYHMGEKGILFKNSLWEEATRIPLIICAPECNTGSQDCSVPVSLIDLYPTLVDLCQMSPDPNKGRNDYPLDGHSLKSLIQNPMDKSWVGPEEATINVCTNQTTIDKYGFDKGGPIHCSIRGKRWRYSLFANGEEELYDHVNDPMELKNLAKDLEFETDKAQCKKKLLENTPEWFRLEVKPNYTKNEWDYLEI